jgi:hypothetical protein
MAQTRKKMKRISRLFLVLGAVFTILFSGLSHQPVDAGKSYGWSPDEKVPGYLDDTLTPFLLADRTRTVHAFGSQWVDADGRRLAIVYRQWTLKGGWTRPVDIILSPIGGDANLLGAFMDSSATMHVTFTVTESLTRRTYVYYSSAPAANADWAPAWSTPVAVGDGASGMSSGSISGDEKGNLVILYSGIKDGSGVYAINSNDSGLSWSNPKPVFLTFDSNLVPYSIKVYKGEADRLHVVWAVNTSLGLYHSIYYAGLNLMTDQWDEPVLLEKRTDAEGFFGPSYPAVIDNGTYVVVMYNSGNPFTGRPVDYGKPIIRVRFSKDNGQSWGEAVDPFPFLVGNSGEHSMVVDNNNVVHTLVIMRIDSSVGGAYKAIGGVWHSQFVNGVWSNPERFVTTLAPVDIRAVVVQGNVIMAAWHEDPGAGQDGVWFTYIILDTPELSVTPLPTKPKEINVITSTPSLLPFVTPNTPQADFSIGRQETPPNPAQPLILGLVPVVITILGVIFFYLPSRKSR